MAENDTSLPDAMRVPASKRGYFDELGRTGLLQYGGWIQEEFLSELTGARWVRIVKEMLANDPVIHSMFFTVELLTRGVEWKVTPGSDDNEGRQRADFVQSNLDDMSQSWKDMISEILSFLAWGFSYHEICYKLRNGDKPGTFVNAEGKEEELPISKFNDGRIGWRKLPIRSQDSLERWEIDDKGGIQGFWQNTLFSRNFIPIDKSLLFRTSINKNSPEGRSLCRRIYRPWYFKQKIENIEGIGIERDLAGLPVIKLPAEYFNPAGTSEQKAVLAQYMKVATNIRNDEQAGLLVPSNCFPDTQIPMFDVKLLSASGTRQFDTGKIIQRYDQRILMTMMADFLLLGHEKVGSFALASSKTELFSIALSGFLDIICDVFNRHPIPKLLRLNGMPTDKQPMLTHGDVETVDLKELAQLVSSVSGTKIELSTDEQDWVLSQAGFPVVAGAREKLQKEAEKKAEKIAKQTAANAPPLNKPETNGNKPPTPQLQEQDGAVLNAT